LLKKVQGGAGNGKGQAKGPLVTADKPEHELVGGQVAKPRGPQQGFAVAVIVLVQGVLPHVEHGIAAQLIRLMNLETQAKSWHQRPPYRLRYTARSCSAAFSQRMDFISSRQFLTSSAARQG
jgi:hypothetical protein